MENPVEFDFVPASHFTLGVLIPEAFQQFGNEEQC